MRGCLWDGQYLLSIRGAFWWWAKIPILLQTPACGGAGGHRVPVAVAAVEEGRAVGGE